MRTRFTVGRIIGCAAALLVLGAPAAYAGSHEQEGLEVFAEATERTCRERHESPAQKALDARMSEGDRVLAELSRELECDCVPAAIRAGAPELARAMRAGKKEEFEAILVARAQACQARAVRANIERLCLADDTKGASARREATCACVAAEVNKLDSKSIVDEGVAAHANFERRVKDRTVPKYEGKLSAIEKRCEQAAGR